MLRTWFTAALIFAIISGDVPDGANKPCEMNDSKPAMPDSFIVGTSGANAERLGAAMATALSLWPLMYSDTAGRPLNIMSTWPLMRSVKAGPLPL